MMILDIRYIIWLESQELGIIIIVRFSRSLGHSQLLLCWQKFVEGFCSVQKMMMQFSVVQQTAFRNKVCLRLGKKSFFRRFNMKRRRYGHVNQFWKDLPASYLRKISSTDLPLQHSMLKLSICVNSLSSSSQ